MPKPKEYIGIMAWGSQMGSHAYYIRGQQERAAETNAPLDAIFENVGMGGVRNGTWATVSKLSPDHVFRGIYEQALKGQKR